MLRPRTMLERIALAIAFVCGLSLLLSSPAGAQVAHNPGDQLQPLLSIDTWVALLGLVVPFATAVFKKFHSPDWQSGLITTALSGIVGFAVEGLQAGDLTFDRWLNASIQCLVIAVLGYFTILSDGVAAVARATAAWPGIGSGQRSRTVEAVAVAPGGDGGGGAA